MEISKKNDMNYILFDDKSWHTLLPLTFTRPVAEIRAGILTMKERWEKFLGQECSYITQNYLQRKYPLKKEEHNIYINSSIAPNEEMIEAIKNLKFAQILIQDKTLIAGYLDDNQMCNGFPFCDFSNRDKVEFEKNIIKITHTYDIFINTGKLIEIDYHLITKGRKSAPISPTNNILGKENIFVEEGASLEFTTVNAKNGFVYIGKNAEIMEGSVIRAPFALCENSTVKLGAKIYGPTMIGPYSKVGGEVNNSVIMGYSNKGHDGFLGNSVLGEWCNIGADTNNSNLKNNYDQIRLWNYQEERFTKTGLQFCGLIMGDHSKCGINTMFNTGTVVGVSANIFGSGFPRNFIPSFSWGGAGKFITYMLEKAVDTAKRVVERRNIELSQEDLDILTEVFDRTERYRRF